MSTARFLRTRLVGFFVLLPLQSANGQDNVGTARVTALVARLDSSWSRRDTAAIRGLLAPEYQYFTSRGSVESRADVLRMAGSPSYALDYAKRSEIAATHRPPAAVVSSRWEGRGNFRGAIHRRPAVGTDLAEGHPRVAAAERVLHPNRPCAVELGLGPAGDTTR